MTWGQEILRAFLLAFGCIEILTNLTYLRKANGLKLARKQHGELPPNLPDKNIRIKVSLMLAFGVIFFGAALISYISHNYIKEIIVAGSVLFAADGIIEAICYKYWKTVGFSIVTIGLLAFSIIL